MRRRGFWREYGSLCEPFDCRSGFIRMFSRILILACCCAGWLCLQLPAPAQDSKVRIESTLQMHRPILEKLGIASDCASVQAFLKSKIPTNETERTARRHIEQLSASKFRDRMSAENALIAIGPAVSELLQDAAANGDTETQYRARRCLESIQRDFDSVMFSAIRILELDPAISPTTSERLKTVLDLIRSGYFSGTVQAALRRAPRGLANGSESVQSFKTMIAQGVLDQEAEIRAACIPALTKCMEVSELDVYAAELIVHPHEETALTAIKWIGFVSPQQSTERLVELLDSTESTTRNNAVSYLRTISGKYFNFPYSAAGTSEGGNELERQAAVDRWQRWVAKNVVTAERVRLLSDRTRKRPTGFLISVSGSQLIKFDLRGQQVWQINVALYDAQYINDNRFVVCERSHNRVRVIDREGKTVSELKGVDSPADAELLENQNFLVAQGAGSVTEHLPNGKLVREFKGLVTPFDTERLLNGNTLVADSGNNRLVEFDPAGNVVWEKTDVNFPNSVFRMDDGRTLYTTYRSGTIAMLELGGKKIWEQNIPGAVFYSAYAAESNIYVADGTSQKIWRLDMQGEGVDEINIGVRFCDVEYVTE